MIQASKKFRLTIVLISVWTIVQTILHAFWVAYAYLLSLCRIKPTYYDVVFVYLTYFYKQSCGPIHMKQETLFLSRTTLEDAKFSNETASDVLYHFLNDTLHRAALPDQNAFVTRTQIYLAVFLIVDVFWIISAVCLSAGTFCKMEHRQLSVLFYGPWLLCSAFINFLDVVSSVQYGIDLIYIQSYTTWLKFMGVSNYGDFWLYDQHPSSSVIPVMPTTVIVSLLSRVFVVWLLNVICFFVILFMALPDLFLKTTVRSRSNSRSSSDGKLRYDRGDELDLNSSEARIRNWQLFYGAIEANSTMASSTSSASASDDQAGILESKKDNGIYETASYSNTSLSRKSSASLPTSSSYRRFSDVTSGVATLPVVPTIKGYIPWSYINPKAEYVRRQPSYTAPSGVRGTEDVTEKTVDCFYEIACYSNTPLSRKSSASLPNRSSYRRFSDVASGVPTLPVVPTIKGYMPWSYINPKEEYVRRQPSYTASSGVRGTENVTEKTVDCTRL